MKRLAYPLFLALVLILAVSCNRLDVLGMVVNRSDTEERVADWLDYDNQNGMPVINGVPDTYSFYACSDSHYSERDSIVPQGDDDRVYQFVTAMRNDTESAFAIHAGDMVNESGEAGFRMTEEALRFNANTQTDDKPCFLAIGNHDVYFDCAQYFKQYFHTSTYTVTVNTLGGFKDLFVILDSGNGTHGRRQLDWLEEQLSHRADYRYCFVISHNWPFRTTYNYTTTPAANLPEDELYAFLDMMSHNDVNMVVMGHFHYCDAKTFGGVKYVMTNNLNDTKEEPTFLVVRCADKITYEYQLLNHE